MNPINLTVRTFDGRECTVTVEQESRIRDVKRAIYERWNYPVETQKLLLYCTVALADDDTLLQHRIHDGTTLMLDIKTGRPIRDLHPVPSVYWTYHM